VCVCVCVHPTGPNEQSTVVVDGQQSELAAAGQLMACCATLSAGAVVVGTAGCNEEGKEWIGESPLTKLARVLISVMVR